MIDERHIPVVVVLRITWECGAGLACCFTSHLAEAVARSCAFLAAKTGVTNHYCVTRKNLSKDRFGPRLGSRCWSWRRGRCRRGLRSRGSRGGWLRSRCWRGLRCRRCGGSRRECRSRCGGNRRSGLRCSRGLRCRRGRWLRSRCWAWRRYSRGRWLRSRCWCGGRRSSGQRCKRWGWC